MIRGTNYLFGKERDIFHRTTKILSRFMEENGYQEFIPSSLAYEEVFIKKAGKEISNQMYTFRDKKNRKLCLIPEVTAIVQKLYKENWEKSSPKPIRLYYLAKCYRYERPQAGRYREFWQFGIEHLGGKSPADKEEVLNLLREAIMFFLPRSYWRINPQVKRGLDYYIEDGFEIIVPTLGAQKQLCGGGRYDCGVGWAIGVDRLCLVYKEFIKGENDK